MNTRKPKCFIYARQSSGKNKQSVSIDSQIKFLKALAGKMGLEITHIYHEVKSSLKPGGRHIFNEMVEELEKRNGIFSKEEEKIDYVLVFNATRVARNIEEANYISEMVWKNMIKFQSYEKRYEDNLFGQQDFLFDLVRSFTEGKRLSIGGTINMDKSFLEGIYCHNEPYGFKKEKVNGIKMIIEDAETSAIVKKIFEFYSTGKYSLEELADTLNDGRKNGTGLPIHKHIERSKETRPFNKKDIENILNNRFYCGDVIIKYSNIKEPQVIEYFEQTHPEIEVVDGEAVVNYTGSFEKLDWFKPLVSRQLFLKCQNILNGNIPEPKIKASIKKTKQVFKWNGLLYYAKIKNYRGTYNFKHNFSGCYVKAKNMIYYRISGKLIEDFDKNHLYVSEKDIDKAMFDLFFSKFSFNDEEMGLLTFVLKEKLKTVGVLGESFEKGTQGLIANLMARQDRYIDELTRTKSEIVKQKIEKKIEKLEEEINEEYEKIGILEQHNEEIQQIVEDERETLNFYLSRLTSFQDKTFYTLPADRQEKMLKTIFKYIILNKQKKIIDFKLGPLYDSAFDKRLEEAEQGISD